MERIDAKIEQARMTMYGRILRCPMKVIPEDCPLNKIRTRPITERVEWIESKSDSEIVELYQHHTKCIKANTPDSTETDYGA
ncbi:MAG: hypothetical protein V3V05_09515 [Pontiella sp.]